MKITRAIVILFIGGTLAFAADGPTAKLRTLDGKMVEGELVKLTDKDVVVRAKDSEVTTPLMEVLDIDLQAGALPPAGTKYVDVELVDGSQFHCSSFALKNKEVALKLMSGQDVKLPLSAVAHMLNDAHDANTRTEWQKLIAKQGNRDLLAIKKGDVVNGLEGTLGEGDDKGETIGFELNDRKVPVRLERVHGMSFFRKLEPGADPLCKVTDTSRNVLVAAAVEQTAAGFTVTTKSGVKVEYTAALLAKLDFSKGKLTYLSDLEPARKVEKSALDGINHYRRDKNVDGGPLRLGGQTYSKGLALQAYTELVYDIGGEYKEFKAVLGIDDQVGGDSNVKVVIEGDNRELFKGELNRKDKKAIPLVVDVKNVKLLRIVVTSANVLDLGDHVDLADAKVSK